MTNLAIAQESLSRAAIGQSFMNYQAIFEGFTARGIPENEIIPRQNVFTFWAWKAVGRRVKKGEHGVKTTTFVPVDGKEKEEGERKSGYRMARTVTVFHVSQTEPEEGGPPPTINLPRPAVAAPSPRADVVVPTHTATSPAAKLRSWAESMQSKIDQPGTWSPSISGRLQ